MGLPGHRRTSSHKRRRAAHFALTEGAIKHCPQCDKPLRPHRACAFCGFYKGRQVLKKSVVKAAPAKKKAPAKTKKKAEKAE